MIRIDACSGWHVPHTVHSLEIAVHRTRVDTYASFYIDFVHTTIDNTVRLLKSVLFIVLRSLERPTHGAPLSEIASINELTPFFNQQFDALSNFNLDGILHIEKPVAIMVE